MYFYTSKRLGVDHEHDGLTDNGPLAIARSNIVGRALKNAVGCRRETVCSNITKDEIGTVNNTDSECTAGRFAFCC